MKATVFYTGAVLFFHSISHKGKAQSDTVSIVVSGKVLSSNGQTSLPHGLFGVHSGNFQGFDAQTVRKWGIESVRTIQTVPTGSTYSPPTGINQVVDCWYDRFVPPANVENPLNWKSNLYQKAGQYVNSLSGINREVIMEFWNEPYLNWAYKPGMATDPQFFDTTGRTEGGPVRLKGKAIPEPYLKWKMAQWYSSPRWASNRQGIYNAISGIWNQRLGILNIPYPGLTGVLNPGEQYYVGTNREFTVIQTLRPVDTTQHSFYSARQNSLYYNEMFKVVADTLHRLKPDLMVAAGWGFEMHKDGGTPWRNLIKPLIDEHHDRIDAIHEHHYSMDTRVIAAGYETMYGYAWQKYGRRFKFLNTETSGYLDPQRPTQPGNSAAGLSSKRQALNAFVYNSKDILYLLAHCPDKAYSRAIHEPQNTKGGARFALENLKSLRGSMMNAGSNKPDLWTVASLSGDSVMTVVCFNNNSSTRNLALDLNAPSGFTFSQGSFNWVDTLANADTLRFFEEPLAVSGNQFVSKQTIPPLQSRIWKFRLSGGGVPDTTKTQQFFADSFYVRIPSGGSGTFPISLPASWISGNAHARLKFVLQNGNAQVILNGTPLPFVYQGDTTNKDKGGISYADVPVQLLTSLNSIQVLPTGNSSEVWMMSLEMSNSPFITSVVKKSLSTSVMVFPNPFHDEFRIRMPSDLRSGWFEINDAVGKRVRQISIPANSGFEFSEIVVPAKDLPSGVYFGKGFSISSDQISHFTLIKH